MSTRSNIALVTKGGAVEAVYCHSHGYPEGVGKTLTRNYDTEEAVAALLAFGNMSVLRDTLETCFFYHRDRGDAIEDIRAERYASLAECVEALNSDIEWLYLFADDRWWVLGAEGFYRLTDVLSAYDQLEEARARAHSGARLPLITVCYWLEEIMDEYGVRPRAFTGPRLRPARESAESSSDAPCAPGWTLVIR